MANCESINYLVLSMTLIVFIMTIILVIFNKRLFNTSERFVTCYPNSSYASPNDSYNSALKGWCEKGSKYVDSSDIHGRSESDSDYGRHNMCQNKDSVSVKPKYGASSPLKSWCSKPQDDGF
tara:strand:+ start:454 stop:819 length:366 start_codon:yes stop_codon:yes gene_type:complete